LKVLAALRLNKPAATWVPTLPEELEEPRTLDLRNFAAVSDALFFRMCGRFGLLESLDVRGCAQVTDAAMHVVAASAKVLTVVQAQGSLVTEACLRGLRARRLRTDSCPAFEERQRTLEPNADDRKVFGILRVEKPKAWVPSSPVELAEPTTLYFPNQEEPISDALFLLLEGRFGQLTALNLTGCKGVGDAAMKVVAASARKLRMIHLTGTSVTDTGLGYLHACKALQVVEMPRHKCGITGAGKRALRAALPKCEIRYKNLKDI
jgi:hypothetical protein